MMEALRGLISPDAPEPPPAVLSVKRFRSPDVASRSATAWRRKRRASAMQLPGSSSLLNSLAEIQMFNGYQRLKIKRKYDASHIALERPTLSLESPTKRTARMLPIWVVRAPLRGAHRRF